MSQSDHSFQKLVQQLISAARSREIVCIVGEVGTGKRQAAVSIHKAAGNIESRFVMVNCLGLLHEDFVVDMFGRVSPDGELVRKGGVALAEGGTLYLHEVTELDKQSQALLVRFLETSAYRPAGGQMSFRANTRVVVSSSGSLEALVEKGQFRSDLSHIITPLIVHMPRLNDRLEDIPILFRSILKEEANQFNRPISEQAIERLKQHSFNGNLVELRNIVSRIMNYKPEGEITETDIEQAIRGTAYFDLSHHEVRTDSLAKVSHTDPVSLALGMIPQEPRIADQSATNAAATGASNVPSEFEGINRPTKLSELDVDEDESEYDDIAFIDKAPASSSEVKRASGLLSLKEQEEKYFRDLLERFDGDKQQVADASDLNLRTLYRRLKALGID